MKTIRVFDVGEKYMDRYQVYVRASGGNWNMFTMSRNALSPQGVNQYAGTDRPMWNELAGVELKANELPDEVQKAIQERI